MFAEQVGFGFFSDRRFDHATTGSADSLRIGQGQLAAGFGSTWREGDQGWHTAALFVFATDEVSWALWGHECRIHAFWRHDLTEVHVETVRAHEQRAGLQIRLDFIAIDIALHFIGKQDVDEIALFGRFRDRDWLEAVADCQIVILAAGALTDDYGATAVSQVLCLGMTLAAVTKDRNCLPFQQGQIGIIVIVNLSGHRCVSSHRVEKKERLNQYSYEQRPLVICHRRFFGSCATGSASANHHFTFSHHTGHTKSNAVPRA